MRLRAVLMICTAFVMPCAAHAGPAVGFFAGLGLTSATTAAVASVVFPGAFAVGSFFTTVVGSLLLNVGLSVLARPKSGAQQAPTIEAARVNTRLGDAPRWQAAGRAALGGAAGIFCEHDAAGNFWMIIGHADTELVGDYQYYLDGIPVQLDGAGQVVTDDFCYTSQYRQYEGTGDKFTAFTLWPVSPSPGNAYGARPAAFDAAFPGLPADFLLAGVCYTILKIEAVPIEHYNTIYRWRGPIGLGEPAIGIVGNFTRMYDPREVSHDIDDPDTWTAGDGNPVIIWAWFRTAKYGRARSMSEINWTMVAAEADKCDEIVLDRAANPIPRYRCGVAFPDNRPRSECEAEILLTCDGFVVYDDDGKAWPRVGVFEVPTLTFSAARDILSAQTEIVDDGEAALDGVIVEYISPQHGYTKQPSAPWRNPFYFNPVSEPNYQTIPILGVQDHNQAVRLAKAIGLRSSALQRAGISTTVKGILAKGERAIYLDYDDVFVGDYEIVSPVMEDSSGQSCAFGVVPFQGDRYDLVSGEEGAPPALTPALDIDNALEGPTDLAVYPVTVIVSGTAGVRIEATFAFPSRPDRFFRFRYTRTGEAVYEYFITNMDGRIAHSPLVDDNTSYDVSWQTLTASGRGTDWSAPATITTAAIAVGPGAVVDLAAADGVGQSLITFTTANDSRQVSVQLRRGVTATFLSSTLVDTFFAGPNVPVAYEDTGLAPDTYYYWAVPVNGSGVTGTAAGPVAAIIT